MADSKPNPDPEEIIDEYDDIHSQRRAQYQIMTYGKYSDTHDGSDPYADKCYPCKTCAPGYPPKSIVQQHDYLVNLAKAKDVWDKFLNRGNPLGNFTAQRELLDGIRHRQENVHFDGYLLRSFPVTEFYRRPLKLASNPMIRNYCQEPIADDIASKFRPNKNVYRDSMKP